MTVYIRKAVVLELVDMITKKIFSFIDTGRPLGAE